MTGKTTSSPPPSNANGDPNSTDTNDPNTRAALTALKAYLEADTLDDLWAVLVKYCGAIDADLLTYHHQAPDFAPDHKNVSLRSHGYPAAWVEKYTRSKLYQTDPITNLFYGRVRPMRWSEIHTLITLTPAQNEYKNKLAEWMTGDGFGFPVFGPSGRNGYVGIGRSNRPIDDWGMIMSHRLHWVAESFHIRWCELILMNMPQNFSLTPRELQILESLAIGTSDEVICGIVGASLDSVRQSIRTLLRKMGVSDRPSAILRAVGAGLLDKDTAILKEP